MSKITAPSTAFTMALNSVSNPEWNSTIKVWHEGQEYDPDFELYRPRYAYLIETPEWQYFGNDLSGGCNETADVKNCARSLLKFLDASAEAYGYEQQTGNKGEHFELFPSHISEWAYLIEDKIIELLIEFQESEGN